MAMAEEARRRRQARRALSSAELEAAAGEREIELAGELELTRARLAGLERRMAQETAAAQGLREQVQNLAMRSEAAERRTAELEGELAAARDALALHDNENDSLRASLDLAMGDNARLTQRADDSDAARDEAQARRDYLTTALSAAEAECARLADEARQATEKLQSETDALNGRLEAMSSRAVTAETLYTDARERLYAHLAQNDAAERRLADARAACGEADRKLKELQQTVRLKQRYIEEIEQSRFELVEATKMLLRTLQGRDTALARAEQKIGTLGERIVQLEAAASAAASRQPIARPAASPPPESADRAAVERAREAARKKWAELASELAKLVKLQRQASAPHSIPALLASTIAF